jgi:hypothetical protein
MAHPVLEGWPERAKYPEIHPKKRSGPRGSWLRSRFLFCNLDRDRGVGVDYRLWKSFLSRPQQFLHRFGEVSR